MSAIRLLALILLCTILLGACGRSELIRIRMLAPVTEDKKDHAIFTDTESKITPEIINKQNGGSLYFFQKLLGNDLVCIHIYFIKWYSNSGKCVKCFHYLSLIQG